MDMSATDLIGGLSRRRALQAMGCGFGSLALSSLAASEAVAAARTHVAPRARRVIFLFMAGGPSHVDSFDHKPKLFREDGKAFYFDDARALAKTGKGTERKVMKPLWDFRQHGRSGQWISDLLPHMHPHADELCVIKSMQTEGVAHGPATLFMHTGATQFVRPSMGAWVSYGLGSESENLPGFVTIEPAQTNGGPRNYGAAFLPARHQGTPVYHRGGQLEFRNLGSVRAAEEQRRKLDLLGAINREQAMRQPGDSEFDALMESYEMGWRMQSHAPGVFGMEHETEETKALYGIGEKETDAYGRQCLLARQMAEAGVRFIQVNYGDNSNNPAWDQHSNMPKHADHAGRTDKPVAGLLADLKRRGLLEDTLVWWGGEFGRTPYAENNGSGRDHNPGGFSVWLAGAGVKPGFQFGATDEWGHHAVEDPVHMHDLHATVLHLLGMDHERLTYRYDGRDFRLTDVHGRVVHELLV
jgi:hypothetical protein